MAAPSRRRSFRSSGFLALVFAVLLALVLGGRTDARAAVLGCAEAAPAAPATDPSLTVSISWHLGSASGTKVDNGLIGTTKIDIDGDGDDDVAVSTDLSLFIVQDPDGSYRRDAVT